MMLQHGFFAGSNTLRQQPKRIVSLVPSQTELLFDLGLEAEVVGITKFCVHPKMWFQSKPKVGGTKSIHIDQVKNLNPDFIIANKEENLKEEIELLSEIAPVWLSDIETFEESMDMITQIGLFTQTQERAQLIIQNIRDSFSQLSTFISPKTAAYLIWRDPWMVVANHTFIHHLLIKVGFINIFQDLDRYPVVTLEEILDANPDYILLSSEPFPFQEKHVSELKEAGCRSKFLFVDGEMFSWYGSRLSKAAGYFKELQKRFTLCP